jgi:sugar phosphate isomerase/epimerase
MTRRTFAATGGAALLQPKKRPVRFGIDLFSIRSSGWSPFEYLDYCAQQGAEVVHFSEIRFLGGLEEERLRRVREHAEKLGIGLEIGMRSICPTSRAFDAKAGTAEEQILRMALAAQTIGSPLIRAFLGTGADRPVDAHIESTVKVLRAVRPRVVDAGLKIAVENHAGDMQARELKTLIEEAGKDFVGACLDSANPLWAIEDPHLTLETLAPYTLTAHLRDSAVWRTPEGAAVAWVRTGEGSVGIDDWVRKFAQLCPGRTLSAEVIVTGARNYNYLSDPRFWDAYRTTPAWEFARFVRLADRGTPRQPVPPVPKEQAPQRERDDLEASLAWTRKLLSSAI